MVERGRVGQGHTKIGLHPGETRYLRGEKRGMNDLFQRGVG